MKQTIFLHIGHPKTGSSAFQSMMAKYRPNLQQAGILYPSHPSLAKAERGHITSGNLSLNSEGENWFTTQLLPTIEGSQNFQKIVFSNENLIHRMADFFGSAACVNDSIQFQVLLAVRNPLEQLSSAYQQFVKRHGYTKSYGYFLQENSFKCQALLRSAEIVKKLEKMRINYTLFNYSHLRSNISASLIKAVGFSKDELGSEVDNLRVNRSMAENEIQLLLFVNAAFGQEAGQRISDALANELPNIQSIRLSATEADEEKIKTVNYEALRYLNERLPAGQPLNLQSLKSNQQLIGKEFDADQILVIGAALRATILKHELSSSPDKLLRLTGRIQNLYTRASESSKQQAIRQLQKAIQKLKS